MRKNSAWEALNCYRQALSTLDQMQEASDQINRKLEVLYLSISPLITLGFPENSLILLEQGERYAKELEDTHKLFRFRTNIGFFYCSIGKYHGAKPYIEQAFNAAKNSHDIDLMGQVITDLYMVCLAEGDHMKNVQAMLDFIRLIEKNGRQKDFFGGPTNVYSILNSFCGLSLGWIGSFKEASTFCDKGNLSAVSVDDARTLGICHYLMGLVLSFKGELQQAIEHLNASIKYNKKQKHTPTLPGSYSRLGFALALSGDSTTGCKYAEKGLKIQLDTGYNYLGSLGWFNLGACQTEAGNFEAAKKNLEKGLKISRENHEKIIEGALLIWLGKTISQCSPLHKDRAAEFILSGIEISEKISQRPDVAVGYLFLAELHSNWDRKDLAFDYLKKSIALFEEMEMLYWRRKAHKVFQKALINQDKPVSC